MEQLTAIVHEDEDRGLCVGYKDTTAMTPGYRGTFPGRSVDARRVTAWRQRVNSSYFSQKHQLLEAEMIGFGGLEDVRFREPVRPGERLVIAMERVRVRPKAMIVCCSSGLSIRTRRDRDQRCPSSG